MHDYVQFSTCECLVPVLTFTFFDICCNRKPQGPCQAEFVVFHSCSSWDQSVFYLQHSSGRAPCLLKNIKIYKAISKGAGVALGRRVCWLSGHD